MWDYSSMPYMTYTPPCMLMQNQYMTQGQFDTPRVPVTTSGLEQYTYPQNVPEALKLIKEAVEGETEDRMFYQYLIDNAPSEEDKVIITGIRDDEISHFALFRQVYFQLTGQTLPPPQNVTFEKPASYCAGVKKALLGEQNAVRKYRMILFALQDRVQINILTRIITDEIRHGILYNYLYSKNGCRV
ncbi:ferritin-like domain-containing protein [Acetivibrio cellulolyticus]|uniref:ferritin-like domain-containing protein n=1 Tax=Acetivibrio cellulolyticus TaxID=35830 RepID=UPI0001E2F06F|nr:ferritin-like domain-containing protein [Acetivibrio cellulolyticus]